jgi:hypothetical protein
LFPQAAPSVETVKLNMQRDYERHKVVMDLLSVFHEKTFTKNLQFYKQFGEDNIYINAPEVNESQAKEDRTEFVKEIDEAEEIQQENSNGHVFSKQDNDDVYTFCSKDIPVGLTKQEFTIYSSFESLLKSAIDKKNRVVLSHDKVVEM